MCFCTFRTVYKKESTAVKPQTKGQHYGLVCKQKMVSYNQIPDARTKQFIYD